MSLFITFEGGEGCGKSYQARMLYKRLLQSAIPVLLTHEPGGTALGKKIRQLVKHAQNTDISPLTELMLFNASRTQLIAEVIQPALQREEIVICDRYADSTTVYQSYGRGLNLEMVRMVNDTATGGLTPDLTVLLDIPAEAGLARKSVRRQDRFEQEDIAFHWRVRQGYLTLAAQEPARWLVIDATQPRMKVTDIIWKRVRKLISQKMI